MSIDLDILIYECRKSKINFCLSKRMSMIYIDMSGVPIWKRALKMKEFVLWEDDINQLRDLISAYDLCKK